MSFFDRDISAMYNPHLDALSSAPPQIYGFTQTLTGAGSISHTELGTMGSPLVGL